MANVALQMMSIIKFNNYGFYAIKIAQTISVSGFSLWLELEPPGKT